MIWVASAVKFDHVAVGFVTETIKEVGYTTLINDSGYDSYLPLGKLIERIYREKGSHDNGILRCKGGISHHPAE
jgi:hypothetical protein